MKISTLIILFLSIFITQAHANGAKSMLQTQEKILGAITNMTEAFENGDIDTVMNSYERNHVVVFEPNKPVSDAELVIQTFKAFASMKPKFTYSGHEVFVADDIAIHIAPWTMTATAPDGQEAQQSGLSVAVLRKQQDGEWKMVIDNPHASHLLK